MRGMQLEDMSMNLIRLVATLALLMCFASVARPAEPAVPPGEKVVRLPDLEVTTRAYCNFGFGIIVVANSETGEVSRIIIDDVLPDSTAAAIGLRKGDEILSVNGKKVVDMKGGMKGGGDLFGLLVNRPYGERIDVEVAVRVVKRVLLVAGP